MVDKDILKKVLFLEELSDPVIERIASVATLETYDEQTVLFHQNQDLTHLFMLVSGKVHCTARSAAGKAVILDKIFEGRTFGISALLEESSSVYSAVCAEKSTVVSISGDQMHQLFKEDFKLGYLLMLKAAKLFKKRMELHTHQFILSLSTHSEIGQL